MSTLLAIALAAAATVQPSCSWDNPGANPYTGNSDAAIDRYTDIPDSTRVKLKRRVNYGNPDEMVVITRDAITGRHHYDPKISDMHFGKASVCSTVTRGKWSEKREEPAAVYCADKHCILVPKICGNVSRITRDPVVAAAPPPELPRRVWEVPAHELGLIDTPPAFDVFTMADPVVIAPIVPPTRPLAAAPVPIPPRDDWNPRPRPTTVLPPPAGGGGPNPLLPSPVAPVPEPETYAMLLGGLALMGVMARRKHRKAAAAAAAS